MSRSRNYCFTHNNYSNTDLEDQIECKYIVYGKEVGDSGTPHLQGFISFKTEKSLKQVIGLLPGSHVEKAIAPKEAIAYCKKDGDFTERGKFSSSEEKGKGEKRRWKDIREASEQGRLDDIPEDIRFKNLDLIERHRQRALRARTLTDTEEIHEWYYGDSGTGKSRTAREQNPNAYLKLCNKWWCGYEDEDVVLIEDFDKKHEVLAHHMKIWGDRYPFLAEVKGGSMKIRPKKLIVTSNYHPREIWSDPSDLNPILRRFKLVHFKELNSTDKS